MEGQGLSTRDLAGGSRADEPPPDDDLDAGRSAPAAERAGTTDAGAVATEDRVADEREPLPEDRGAVAERDTVDRGAADERERIDEGGLDERDSVDRDSVGTVDRGAGDDRETVDRDTGGTTDAGASASTGDVASGDAPALLPADENNSFQRRWEELQTAFVDDPRRTVEQADELVAQVMQRLAEGFAAEREQLEAQWGRGEDISTEDLRVALQRYRAFFQRLLSA